MTAPTGKTSAKWYAAGYAQAMAEIAKIVETHEETNDLNMDRVHRLNAIRDHIESNSAHVFID